jgi:Hypervirulence associated proteins TUDOR domain
MPKSFKIHDRVSWNSEAGRVSGSVIRIHTRDFKVNGYTMRPRTSRNTRSRAARRIISPSTRLPRLPGLAIDAPIVRCAR